MTEYDETIEDNNVGICIDCKYYRARQKREKYPHCTYMLSRTFETIRLKGEKVYCKKYEGRKDNA